MYRRVHTIHSDLKLSITVAVTKYCHDLTMSVVAASVTILLLSGGVMQRYVCVSERK